MLAARRSTYNVRREDAMTEQKDRGWYAGSPHPRGSEDPGLRAGQAGKLMAVYSGKGQVQRVRVGFCHDLRWADWIFPLHRTWAPFSSKGPTRSELMRRSSESGTASRRGGFYLHGGNLWPTGSSGRTSCLGATYRCAAGIGVQVQIRKEDRVAIAFFGEGASQPGGRPRVDDFAGCTKLP